MRPERLMTTRKRGQPYWLVWLLVVMPLCIGALSELADSLYSVRYFLDIVWLLLLVLMIQFRRKLIYRSARSLIPWVVVFFFYTLLMYIPQYQSGIYYLWAARNNFRFYVAFFAFVAFLSARDIQYYFKLYDIAFWLHFIVALIQFFVLDLGQDFLGGIFGAREGTNGYSNIFMSIIVAKSVVFYLNKKESLLACALKCAAALLIAAMAEMKFFFAEFAMIVLLAVMYTGFLWRKLLVAVAGLVAVFTGAALLTKFFPYFADWFSVQWFLETALSAVGYTGSGDLNRLTAISDINELWLKHFGQRLVGLGMGNCETATFEFLQTPFFQQYGDMHYSWIGYAMMYLECGWLGLIFYFGFFALVYWKLCNMQNQTGIEFRSYIVTAKIAVVLCALISVYNNTMRAEPAYMLYFVMAVPFALQRSIRSQ